MSKNNYDQKNRGKSSDILATLKYCQIHKLLINYKAHIMIIYQFMLAENSIGSSQNTNAAMGDVTIA
jgi:hypothetical protein